MWVQRSIWMVPDDGIELEVGDIWETKLDIWPEGAREVDPGTPVALELIGKPLTTAGPRYEIVARVVGDEQIGVYMEAGSVKLEPQHLFAFRGIHDRPDELEPRPTPVGTVLSFQSELLAGAGYFFNASDPSVASWEIRQIYVRQWTAVPAPDRSANSYRRDPSAVRFRPIRRMQMWDDERTFDGEGISNSDYVMEVTNA